LTVWEAYWSTVRESALDWVILGLGVFLILAQTVAILGRLHGRSTLFVQGLDRYRIFCLALTDLLPVGGLLGTTLALMYTFKTFQSASGETPDLSQMIRTFAPAMSTTISGLIMVAPNLVLNAVLWLLRVEPAGDKDGE
jgi:hypothetical protein